MLAHSLKAENHKRGFWFCCQMYIKKALKASSCVIVAGHGLGRDPGGRAGLAAALKEGHSACSGLFATSVAALWSHEVHLHVPVLQSRAEELAGLGIVELVWLEKTFKVFKDLKN